MKEFLMEKWDVYDIHKNKIKNRRTIKSSNELRDGEYNLVTVSWIYNSKGELLMQKRAANKTYPLVYANHGGRVQSGESSKDSIIRELKEEIGIMFKEDDLTLLRTFNDSESIFDEYIAFREISLKDITIDKREVDSCIWCSLLDLSDLIDNGKCFDYKSNNPAGVDSFSIISNFLAKV